MISNRIDVKKMHFCNVGGSIKYVIFRNTILFFFWLRCTFASKNRVWQESCYFTYCKTCYASTVLATRHERLLHKNEHTSWEPKKLSTTYVPKSERINLGYTRMLTYCNGILSVSVKICSKTNTHDDFRYWSTFCQFCMK